MKTRIIAAVVLLPLLLAILLAAPKIVTAVLFSVMCSLSVYELIFTTGLVKHLRLVAYSMVMAFLIPIWSYFGMPELWGNLALLVYFVAMFVEMMLSHIKLRFEKVVICFFAAIVIPYMLSSVVRIQMMNRAYVMIPFVSAFLADSGAYFIGKKWGHRKLAPVISPKKTVEGAIGGIVTGMVCMLVYAFILQLMHFRVNYLYALIYGLLGAVASVFGDLCFSVIKRQTGVKDYGNVIPGHGGVLDRFDSMVVVGCVMEVLLIMIPLAVK